MGVLLDSTYLLPVFGIKVVGLSDDGLLSLRDLALKGAVRFHCVDVRLVEILSKVYKEYSRRGLDADSVVRVALRSLSESGMYTWVILPYGAFELAFRLRKLGHADMIDNILYATACVEDMVFLSMDRALVEFLKRHGLRTDIILDHRELLHRCRREN